MGSAEEIQEILSAGFHIDPVIREHLQNQYDKQREEILAKEKEEREIDQFIDKCRLAQKRKAKKNEIKKKKQSLVVEAEEEQQEQKKETIVDPILQMQPIKSDKLPK